MAVYKRGLVWKFRVKVKLLHMLTILSKKFTAQRAHVTFTRMVLVRRFAKVCIQSALPLSRKHLNYTRYSLTLQSRLGTAPAALLLNYLDARLFSQSLRSQLIAVRFHIKRVVERLREFWELNKVRMEVVKQVFVREFEEYKGQV